jgi:hypothetical protein
MPKDRRVRRAGHHPWEKKKGRGRGVCRAAARGRPCARANCLLSVGPCALGPLGCIDHAQLKRDAAQTQHKLSPLHLPAPTSHAAKHAHHRAEVMTLQAQRTSVQQVIQTSYPVCGVYCAHRTSPTRPWGSGARSSRVLRCASVHATVTARAADAVLSSRRVAAPSRRIRARSRRDRPFASC